MRQENLAFKNKVFLCSHVIICMVSLRVTSLFQAYLDLEQLMLTGGCYIEVKYPLLKNTHLTEMESFRGKFEILRTITESAIFQQVRKGFGFLLLDTIFVDFVMFFFCDRKLVGQMSTRKDYIA